MRTDRASRGPVDPEDLDRALARGALPELPPSVPPGFLGEVAPDLRKIDDFRPSLSAGIIQESTTATRWLTIVLLYLLLLTAPLAAWLLWRDSRISLRFKLIASFVGLAGYVAWFWSRGLLGS